MSQILRLGSSTPPPGTVVIELTADTGGTVGPDGSGNINIVGGENINTVGTPGTNTVTINLDESVSLPNSSADESAGVISLGGFPFLHNYGVNNTFLGTNAGNFTLTPGSATDNTGTGAVALNGLTTGARNTAYGVSTLSLLQDGNDNTAIGYCSLPFVISSSNNVVVGDFVMSAASSGDDNTAVGSRALGNILTGNNNAVFGILAGSNYVGGETSNLLLASQGVAAENNTIRIGTQGAGASQQNRAFIAGVYPVDVGNVATVVSIISTGQLGRVSIVGGPGLVITPSPNTITISASPGTFVQTITGNSGGALSPTAGNINIVTAHATAKFVGAVSTETLDFGLDNLVLGSALPVLTTGNFNTGLGQDVLKALTSGNSNVGVGWESLLHVTTGSSNVAVGQQALDILTTGSANTAVGLSAGINLVSGSFNVFIGSNSGDALTTTESNNILLNHNGVILDNNTLRIGVATGAGTRALNKAFICGIDGVNVGSVAKVITMASDQLGTATITAGTGITVTPTANTITIAATGTTTLTYTAVSTTPYVVLTTDEYLGVDSSGGVRQINLPNAPSTGRVYYIKDSTGSAVANNITVTTVGGVVLIDGATTFVMNTARESISVIFNGSAYEIF